MRPGEKLPGVRELVTEFEASAATISSALAELAALGLVRAEPGRGTFVIGADSLPEADFAWQSQALGRVRVDPDRASRLGVYGTPEHVPLSWGYLSPELQPAKELTQIASRSAKNPRSWAMSPPAGNPDLRRLIAADYRADPNDVLVVAGGQQALVYAMRTLAEPGATVITESPSYPGAILAAQSAGLQIASVPADRDGIRVDQLADSLERTKARVVYLQPSFANPTGAVLSDERRTRVLELAAEHGAFLIEDDWARHLAIEENTPEPLSARDPNGHVVSISTLSKPVSPSLRLGAIVARGPAGTRLTASRTADDLCVSPIVQEIALELMRSTVWNRHLKRLKVALAAQRDEMVGQIRGILPGIELTTVPRGGLHLWARLPQGSDTREICSLAYSEGVLIGDGRHFFVDEPPAPFLRFSYGAASRPQIAEGVRRLAALETNTWKETPV
jgi:DNA-binding transcriptional MocR family regulator